MPLLSDRDRKAVEKELSTLKNPVKLAVFTQETECLYCRETRSLMEEVSGLSGKIVLDIFDFVRDKDAVDKYKIDKIPAVVVAGSDDYGIRFFGIPSGYEFASLLHSIKMVSSGESGLSKETKEFLGSLKKELYLQVFVTPT